MSAENGLSTGGLRLDGALVRGGATIELDLSIEAGQTVALVGPNGAGKSTTLEVIAGLLALDRGRLEIGGSVLDVADQEIFVSPERRRVGMVFQRYHLFEHLTVHDNVAFGLKVRGRTAAEVADALEPWIERLHLGLLLDRRPGELSGGQSQRVAIARALAIAPEVLLLDEPLAALDPESKVELRQLLADELRNHPGVAVVVTHDPADAALLADDIGVLEAGRLTQRGTADDLRHQPASNYVASFFAAS